MGQIIMLGTGDPLNDERVQTSLAVSLDGGETLLIDTTDDRADEADQEALRGPADGPGAGRPGAQRVGLGARLAGPACARPGPLWPSALGPCCFWPTPWARPCAAGQRSERRRSP